MGSKSVSKGGRPSRSEVLRKVIMGILEDYEREGVSPPDFYEVVQILEEAELGFSVRIDFLRITLGAGVSSVCVTWNGLVMWSGDRPWRGKTGQKKKLSKK